MALPKRLKGLAKSAAETFAKGSEAAGLALKRSGWARSWLGRSAVDSILWPSDLYKVLSTYRNTFGRYPRLVSPKTFNEHLQRDKLINRSRLRAQLADKVRVRDYVAAVVGEQYLSRVLWVAPRLRDVPVGQLPKSFVVKVNQGSGRNLIVMDSGKIDWDSACRVTNDWLRTDNSVRFAEWQYRWVKPLLLIEEFMAGEEGTSPVDYKFFCFHGRAEIVQIDLDRATAHKRLLVDRQFTVLPVRYEYPEYEGTVPRPPHFEEMLSVAETLARGFRFVRVDLYDVDGPVFGEMTFHPEGALGRFVPSSWDLTLGAFFDPTSRRALR